MAQGEPLPAISLPRHVIESLTSLVRNQEHLAKIAEAVAAEPPGVSRFELSRKVAEKTNLLPPEVLDVFAAFVSVRTIQQNLGLDAEKVVDALTVAVQRSEPDDWKKTDLSQWQRVATALKTALRLLSNDDNALSIANKVDVLTWAHQYVMFGSRIITDVRPIFDAAGEHILKTVISHSLLIEYGDGTDQRRIMFAMDSKDIAKLLAACQRAEVKTRVALDQMRELNPFAPPGQQP